MAHFDADTIIVYQAFSSSIGQYALAHGCFGGEFSYSRMSWIKTNFMWMMYRSGWGTKPGQQIILAIRIPRPFFDNLLAQAVPSSFNPGQYKTFEEWKHATLVSTVRMQWDPDHRPRGTPVPRRALQLGLRGRVLKEYGRQQIIEMVDISGFVVEQRANISADRLPNLVIPREREYIPADLAIQQRLQLDINAPTYAE